MNIADGLFYKENFHVLSSLNIIELDRKILIYYIQNYLRFNEINSFIYLDINKTAEKYWLCTIWASLFGYSILGIANQLL